MSLSPKAPLPPRRPPNKGKKKRKNSNFFLLPRLHQGLMGTVTDGANGMRPGRGSALILARLVTYAPVAGPSAEHAAPRDPRCRRAGTMTGTEPKQTEGRGSASSSSLLIVLQSVSFSLRAVRPHRCPAAVSSPALPLSVSISPCYVSLPPCRTSLLCLLSPTQPPSTPTNVPTEADLMDDPCFGD